MDELFYSANFILRSEKSKMLTLPIKKKWFDMILSGEKKEEYREIKRYYESRLDYQEFKDIIFRNGYSRKSPYLKARVKIKKGYGKEEWGAEPWKKYYVLEIVEIMEVGNSG